MTKQEYLDLLRYYLEDLPSLVVNDIIYDYEEHFNIGLGDGKSEEEISAELGSPELIAQDYLATERLKRKKPNQYEYTYEDSTSFEQNADDYYHTDTYSSNKKNKIILLILAAIILSPAILALVSGIIGIIFGIFGAGVGFVAGGVGLIASLIAYLFAGNVLSLSPLTTVAGGIFMVGFGILILYAGIKVIQWLYKAIKNLIISLRWRFDL